MSETLEQVAENYSKITLNKSGLMSDKQVNGFIAGVKWQQERSYSEEEVLDLLYKRDLYLFNRDEKIDLELPEQWFEQFKKK